MDPDITSILLRTMDDSVPALATVFLMLFLCGFMIEMGLFQRASCLARPLASASHLPAVAASTFAISLGSALAANAVIARLKDEGHLSDRQAFFSAILNSVPVYFRELFTYQLAFVVPVLGLFVGGAYAIVAVSTGIIKLLLVMILGRAFLDYDASVAADIPGPGEKRDPVEAAIRSLRGQGRIFLRIAALYLSMTFLILYLSDKGILASLDVLPLAHLFRVPPETVIPLTIYVASPKAGISLLGPMIQNGGITESKALIVLMLGSLFMLPVYSIRSLMPNYTSIFGLRLGLSLVVVSTGISVLVRLMVLVLLLLAVER